MPGSLLTEIEHRYAAPVAARAGQTELSPLSAAEPHTFFDRWIEKEK